MPLPATTRRLTPLPPPRLQFTSGADTGVVIELYRKTATALLGSLRELEYKELEWTSADYLHLGKALRYCGSLEKLWLNEMGLGDADAAAVLKGLSLPSLKELRLRDCSSLTKLPEVSALTSLETLYLRGCSSLTKLPEVSALTSLEMLYPPDHLDEDEAYLKWRSRS